jgi:hypothetical protein
LPETAEKIEITEYTIKQILEEVFIWEEELQICFVEYLSKTVIALTKHLQSKKVVVLVNSILKFYITTIATDESTILTDYLNNFDYTINNFNAKIEINKELVDYINSMGAFGKDTKSRRYSAYFCSCIYRVRIYVIFR